MSMKALVSRVCITVLACTACGHATTAAPTEDDVRAAVFSDLTNRAETADGVVDVAVSLADYLPSQQVIVDGAEPRPLSDGIVVGRVVDAVPIADYKLATGEDGEEYVVSIDVEDSWAVGSGDLDVLVVSQSPDEEVVVRGLKALGRVIVLLDGDLGRADGLHGVAEDGAGLGLVDDRGAIEFPAMTGEAAFLGSLRTVDDLDRTSEDQQPPIVIKNHVVVSR